MNLGKGIVWAAILMIMALLAGFLHITMPFTLLWSGLGVAIAHFTVRHIDLSQSRFLPVLTKMEKYRAPTLILSLPLSLILIPVNFGAGFTAIAITAAIMVSYTLPDVKRP
jgi:hypothetical protein